MQPGTEWPVCAESMWAFSVEQLDHETYTLTGGGETSLLTREELEKFLKMILRR